MENLDPGYLPQLSQADQLRVVSRDRVIRHSANTSLISSLLPRPVPARSPRIASLGDPPETRKNLKYFFEIK